MSNKEKLDAVTNVDIDADGIFKYVLIKLFATNDEKCYKYIVRGFATGEYHMDIYEELYERVRGLGLDTKCVGGGRIEHKPSAKSINVYGYSQGYGQANHKRTCSLLKKCYPDYTNITWSNEGY